MEKSDFVKKNEESFFAIWKALKAGENDTAMALLEGLDVKAVVNSSKKTLLHLSAFYGNVSITNHLVKCGCIIDAEDDCEITPLILAMYYRHLEVIQILIDAGADLCRVTSTGKSPIFYAKLENDPKIDQIIRLAFKNKKVVKYEAMKLYIDAVFYNTQIIKGLYDMYCTFNLFKSRYYGIGECSAEEVPLIKAILLSDVHQLQMNINYGQVSPNIQGGNGWNAVHAVATKPFLGMDSIRLSRLYAHYKLSNILQILFDHGADVNAKDNKGATPLHVAAAFDHAEVCIWLLKQGANVDARDNEGRTPLYVACVDSIIKAPRKINATIEILLKNGADLFTFLSSGQTILESTKLVKNLSMRNFILKNLAISRSLGKPVNEKHLEVLRKYPEMQSYYKRCELELRLAKEDMIIDNMTLFDSLTKSTRALAVCVKNKDFHRFIKSCKWRDNYPIFAKRIQRQFEVAENRVNMTNEVAVILSKVTPCFSPDHLALQHLLSFLTYEDLQTLTNCNDDHRSKRRLNANSFI